MEIPGLLHEKDVYLALCKEEGMSSMALLLMCEEKVCACFQSFHDFSVEQHGSWIDTVHH